MPIRWRRPSAAQLRELAARSANDPLTYEPAGISTSGTVPPDGYRRDRWERVVGHGRPAFDLAARTLCHWGVHAGAGLAVDAPPVEPGLVVALAAPLPVGWVDIACRVVEVIDTPDRRGFAYGTLPVHPERGEEAFTVHLRPDGDVVFEIVAVWRLRHPLGRAFPPIARRLQRTATERYLHAMEAAVRR